jgi:hypothetical protein
MMETGKGITGHVTTLGNTIFYVEMDDLQAYLDKAASLSGITLVPPVPIPTGTLAWMRIPKETRSASGNPLPTECKNSRHPGVRKLASAFAEASLSRLQFPYSSQTPISNPHSRGSSGPLENARRAHATADAHGHQPITRVAPFEFAQNRRRKFRACATQRMA